MGWGVEFKQTKILSNKFIINSLINPKRYFRQYFGNSKKT
ncbi:hypothetical protein ASZ90_004681 [hydrocarbon metagenome]|uniref:Uncharacterized protein n=1 Tax=hydrocarbon metagenome TaxID=938273 RepID=A0A0W8FXD5_9ZZZZ